MTLMSASSHEKLLARRQERDESREDLIRRFVDQPVHRPFDDDALDIRRATARAVFGCPLENDARDRCDA
jgi:hypothetical protein